MPWFKKTARPKPVRADASRPRCRFDDVRPVAALSLGDPARQRGHLGG